MNNCQYVFTVFTPTYNRAHTLYRVYDSLKQQTFTDFEWLIVDDGSTDDTKTVVEQWQAEANFPIRYLWQENQGKHVAFNHGVKKALGELFLPADSDDAFVPHSLEVFYRAWNDIPEDKRAEFSAVTALCMDEQGQLVGDKFPRSPLDSNSEEVFYRYRVSGEKWGFNTTEALRLFPFPEIDGFKFISESYIWFRMAKKYKTRFINEMLRIYVQDAGNQLTKRSPQDTAPARIFYADNLNISIDWLQYAPIRFLKTMVQYIRFSVLMKDSISVQLERLTTWRGKCLWFAACVPGYCCALRDKIMSRFNTHAK